MRQYGEVMQVITNPAPRVVSTSGLGTNGGAGTNTPDGDAYGEIAVIVGTNPALTGNIVLSFSVAPPPLFIAGPESFGPLTVTGQGTTTITITWATANLRPGSTHKIAYEWASMH